jgi:hypothetical protein
VPRDAGRDDADAEGRIDPLQRDLVQVPEVAGLHRLHLPEPEVEEDRLLRPLVDDPAVLARLRDAELAAVEQLDRLLDGRGVELAALPQLVDALAQAHGSTSSRIAAALAHSSSVGTSA